MTRTFCCTTLVMLIVGTSANAPMAGAQQREQIQICHINPVNARTIMVDVHALPTHLAHGDYVGACDVVIPL